MWNPVALKCSEFNLEETKLDKTKRACLRSILVYNESKSHDESSELIGKNKEFVLN